MSYDSTGFFNVSQGDAVSVAGRFVYDSEHLRYTIEIDEEKHGIFIIEEY